MDAGRAVARTVQLLIDMKKHGLQVTSALTVAGAVLLFGACQQELPTSEDDTLAPIGATTVEVRLSFEDFATAARVFGGFGRASELGDGFVAHEFGDGLEAVTLLRFGDYPVFAQVVDTTGTQRPDSALTFLSGRIVTRFDTLGSVLDGPIEVTAEALTEPWDARTATWANAVDSLGGVVPWSMPGGGAVETIGTATWDPAEGDSIAFVVDSALVAAWGDSSDFSRGIRLSTSDPGVRLEVLTSFLTLNALPSLNPDTIIQVSAITENLTFMYDPLPDPPPDGLRVGGAPAWRSVLDLALPTQLNGPPELCEAVGCPVDLNEDVVSFAGLRLTSSESPAAFAPSDTLSMDLRMVLAPDLLPKSPLGPTTTGLAGEVLAPEWFSTDVGRVVEVPFTTVVRDLLRGETIDGDPVSNSIALLSSFEPLSLQFVSFK